VVATFKPQWLKPTPLVAAPSVFQAAPPAAGASSVPLQGFALAARAAAPAVVSITANKAPQALALPPQHPLLPYLFGQRGREAQARPQTGLGSGVIVSPEGYLLTNNHVVEGASEIEVQLADGREAVAELVGTDPETDLAVLKIQLDTLPVIVLGDPQRLHVGDAVLAIGNPFNVGQTVTAGIVSALGRNRLNLATFENFIQTDAAINPGNSGGALVNVEGQLVGINTAIATRSGGSQGIGFAVPVDIAREVMDSLVKFGQVRRGWLGVELRELTPELVQTLGLDSGQTGVLITGVMQDGPAAKAGVRPGDVIVKVGDTDIGDQRGLLGAVAALPPQTSTTLQVQRRKESLALKVTVAQRPKPQAAR
jgi:serine protease DegQ